MPLHTCGCFISDVPPQLFQTLSQALGQVGKMLRFVRRSDCFFFFLKKLDDFL